MENLKRVKRRNRLNKRRAVSRKLNSLVLCEYFSKGRKIKRWLKPQTVVEVECTQCKGGDFAYAGDAATHVCMDCFACNEDNAELSCEKGAS